MLIDQLETTNFLPLERIHRLRMTSQLHFKNKKTKLFLIWYNHLI